MNKVKIGAHIHWCVEGTLNQVEEGVVVALLNWPLTNGIRAYVVEPDNPAVIASIVPASSVVERTTQRILRPLNTGAWKVTPGE